MIYFISDLHFHHLNIIKSCNRPFTDPIEMNESLIQNYNNIVQSNDEVYILGDLAYRYPEIQSVNECIERLNGRKFLIKGNHDDQLLEDPLFNKEQFEWIKNYYELPITAKKSIVLFHYPIYDWNNKYKGNYHLYGHIHNQTIYHMPRGSYNVSVENINYKPISLDEILNIFSEQRKKKKSH